MRSLLAFVAVSLVASPAAAEVLDGWPCAGCITVTPGTRDDAGPPAPRPLLVALHGDGGDVRALVRAWKKAAEDAGVVLVAPRCPRDLGCPAGSWWQWYQTSGHDPAWLGAQIDAVTARFPADPRRLYATGYSGGATYLGWYAPEHAERFAAVAHVAGGVRWSTPACPDCKLPVLFVLGATDPMIVPYTRPLHDWYEGCGGHEIVWETLRGVTHESILSVLSAGRAKQIMGWLLGHEARCAPPEPPDAGPPDAAPEAPPAPPDPPAAPPPAPSDPPAPPRVAPPTARCACSLGERPAGAAWMGAAAAIFALLVMRRAGRR